MTLTNPQLGIQVGTDKTGTFPTIDLAWVEIWTAAPLPPPSLTSLNPTSGNQGQSNLNITLTGSNFAANPTCSFGAGITVNSCTYNSPTQATANISIATTATVGSRNVTFTNSDGQNSTLLNGFNVQSAVPNPPPTLTSATPNAGAQGQSGLSVALAGTNFLTGAACNFGAGITVNSCTYNSASSITANITIAANATAGARNITVTNTDGQSATLTSGFTVTSTTTHIDFTYPDRTSLLAGGWSFIATAAAGGTRNTEVSSGSPTVDYNQTTHPGMIRLQLGSGEIYGISNNSQNTLFRALPANWTSIRLKVASFNPTSNFQQVGLLLYQDDDNYVNVDRVYVNGSNIESFTEKAAAVTYVNRLPLTNTGNLIIRLDQTSANNFTSYYSTDGGATWTQIGSTTMTLTNPQLGIQVGTDKTGTFPTIDLAWVEIL
jgi:regulation of enolase protein 1 (concanavalin A-like superfamily)